MIIVMRLALICNHRKRAGPMRIETSVSPSCWVLSQSQSGKWEAAVHRGQGGTMYINCCGFKMIQPIYMIFGI